MKSNNRPGKLGDLKTYLSKTFKFFDLKNERLTPIIFTVVLFAFFSSNIIPVTSEQFLPLYTLCLIAIYLASSIYLIAYIKEIKGEEYSLKSCLSIVSANVFKIVIASLLYFIALTVGFTLLIVPGIIIFVMFMFNTCFILDKGYGIFVAFGKSKGITDGYKWEIFSIILVFNLMLFLPMLFIMLISMSSKNALIYPFVLSFVASIINIMQQRMTALMYIELEYGMKISQEENEED